MRVSTSEITVAAPLDIVWAAITLPEHVRRWQYDSELTTGWVVGQPIRFRAEWQGQVFEQWGTVLEFDAPTRLRYSLFAPRPGLDDRPENYFAMTYELADVGGGTNVTFIHEDPREGEMVPNITEEDNPILMALRDVAQSLVSD